MANEIKIDSVTANPYMRYTPPVNDNNVASKPVAEVQISNKVDNLVKELVQNPEPSIDDSRVDAMISALKDGQYKVDYNRLANNLVIELIDTSRLPGGAKHGNNNN